MLYKEFAYSRIKPEQTFFILLLTAVGQCTDVLPDIGQWAAISPPLKPKVWSAINQLPHIDPFLNLGDKLLDAEISTIASSDTSLTIRNGSALELRCLARYPVIWWKKGDSVPWREQVRWEPQWRTMNESLHKSFMTYNVVTEETAFGFECRPEGFYEKECVISVDIFVDSTPDFILLAADMTFSVLYFTPSKTHKAYLKLPNGEKIHSDESVKNGYTIDSLQITQNLRLFNITILQLKNEDVGDYQFVIETASEKGTVLNDNRTFTLFADGYGSSIITTFATISPEETGAYFLVGRVYMVVFQLLDLPAEVRGDFEAEVQLPYDRNCEYRQVARNKLSEECGIIAPMYVQNSIELTFNAIRACRFLARLTIGSGSHNRTETRRLRIIPMEDNFFSIGEFESLIVSSVNRTVESGVAVLPNSSLTLRCMFPVCDSSTILWCIFEGTKIKQCIAANWAENGISYEVFRPENGISDIFRTENGLSYNGTRLNDDPGVKSSVFKLSTFTMGYDLNFPSLSLNHTGEYRCISRSVSNTGNFNRSFFVLTVKDPVAPKIRNGDNQIEEITWLQKGGHTTLKCEVESGFPIPNMNWFQYLEAGAIPLKNSSGEMLRVDQPGLYECKIENQFGKVAKKFRVQYYDGVSQTTIAAAVPILLMVLLTFVIALYWRRRQAKQNLTKKILRLFEGSANADIDKTKPLNEQVANLIYDRDYELPRESFVLGNKIGEGHFGKVYRGVLKLKADDSSHFVAVKTLKDPSNFEHCSDLIGEYKIMSHITAHVNVLSLHGICYVQKSNEIFLLTEFCEFGSLEEYLKHHSNESSSTLMGYAYQAASGMKHLAAHNIIHLDLALRNLLLTSKEIVKISDFGMSRCQDLLHKKRQSQEAPLPFRWMAPESLDDATYTKDSDVWSFGIVLWEIYTCRIPYYKQGIHEIRNLCNWLRKGFRLEMPEKAPQEMYDLMLSCWSMDPKLRPSFSECKRRLGQYLERTDCTTYSFIKHRLLKEWPAEPAKTAKRKPNCGEDICMPPSSTAPTTPQAPPSPPKLFENASKLGYCPSTITPFRSHKDDKNPTETTACSGKRYHEMVPL